MVKRAVTKNVSIWNCGKNIELIIYKPVDIITSWKRVIIVINAKLKELIPEIAQEKERAI